MNSPYRAHLLSAISAISFLAAVPAQAQDSVAPDEEEDAAEMTDDEIIVIAERLRGQLDVPQPPILVLDEEAIAAYGVGSIAELVEQLAPVTGSGSGRGDGRPVFLINGMRVSSFREFRSYPPEAILRVEVLPEEVALRYGFPANQRVMNFILKSNFTSREVEVEYGQPFRGGNSTKEVETTYLKINGPSRFNLNFEWNDTSLLTEAERGVVQTAGNSSDLATDPDPAKYRSLVADASDYELTGNWTTKLGENGSSLSVNGTVERADSLSYSGLNTVELVDPNGSSLLRTFGEDDPLRRRSRTTTYSLGSALNAPLGDWQFTATLDASREDSESKIDRRVDTSALVAAAAARELAIDGALPTSANGGYDRANSTTDTIGTLATFIGHPVMLPAGEVSATFDTGYNWTRIQSTDTRNPGLETELSRGDLSAGINIGLPIASRREDFLAWLGDVSLNFSAGVDQLSDFGTLTDWSAGVVWGITDKLSLQANYIARDEAPGLSQLGSPEVQTLNVPVYDLSRGETVLVTTTSGGNPDLDRQKQRDLRVGLMWQLPFLKNSNFQFEYIRNRSYDVASSFPLLTPAIEAAFPGRVTRDSSGQLVAIDQRPVTFERQNASRLRFGLNISGPFGKANPAAASTGASGRAAYGGGAGQGGSTYSTSSPQGGPGGSRFGEIRQQLCSGGATPDISALPERLQEELRGADGQIDPAKLAEFKSRACDGNRPGGPGQSPRFVEFRQKLCAEGETLDPAAIPEEILERLRGADGKLDTAKLAELKTRVCSRPDQGRERQEQQNMSQEGAPPAMAMGGPPPGGPGEGGFRSGGFGGGQGGMRGPGGPGGGMRGMMRGSGGGDGRGRWSANISYTLELENEVMIAEGLPVLNLLDGDALTGGGVTRHSAEIEGGLFYRGFGLRLSGVYSGSSRIDGSGLPGSSDLHFGSLATVNLRLFTDLGQRQSLVNASPFFKGARLSLKLDNVFDSYRTVTDQNGDVPLSYQRALMEPEGRSFAIEFRKLF